MRALTDLIHLFFPEYCPGCRTPLVRGEELLCLGCLSKLSRCRITEDPDNRVERLFWGRLDLVCGTALLHMPRRGLTHTLIHALKYDNRPAIGHFLGRQLGYEVRTSARFPDPDAVVPVPLHPEKAYQRGYNQCDHIAAGIAEALDIPVLHALRRTEHRASQTRKGRYDRWMNVGDLFEAVKPGSYAGRHLLLVDDVLTTGATIEACGQALLAIPDVRLSVAALAIPDHR